MTTSSKNEIITLDCTLLYEFMTAALVKIGVPKKDARICAEVTL